MKIVYDPFLPKTREQKNHYLSAAIIGCALGGSLCVLTTAPASLLLLSGWGLAGSISALALSFFSKIEPSIPNLCLRSGKTLPGFQKDLIKTSLFVAPGHDILEVYDPKLWSQCIELFAQKEGFKGGSQEEKWYHARMKISKFIEFLVTLKFSKNRAFSEFLFFNEPLYLPCIPQFRCIIAKEKKGVAENLHLFLEMITTKTLKNPVY